MSVPLCSLHVAPQTLVSFAGINPKLVDIGRRLQALTVVDFDNNACCSSQARHSYPSHGQRSTPQVNTLALLCGRLSGDWSFVAGALLAGGLGTAGSLSTLYCDWCCT